MGKLTGSVRTFAIESSKASKALLKSRNAQTLNGANGMSDMEGSELATASLRPDWH
jgi:hypothetical protein